LRIGGLRHRLALQTRPHHRLNRGSV
jgi:hypothetical protein